VLKSMTWLLDVSPQQAVHKTSSDGISLVKGRAMQPTEGQGSEPKSRRGRGNKSPKTQEPKSKVKIAAYVSLESARRLGIHSTMTGQDRSAIIDSLIREHLRDWVVQYRPSGSKVSDDPETLPEAQAG
jgi:hypothetical protein